MKFMKSATKPVKFNGDISQLSCSEALERLEGLVSELSKNPPADKDRFKEMYFDEIRAVVQHIEGCQRGSADKFLGVLDTDFRDAWAIYSPGLINSSEKSALALDYNFFVGGLEIYLASLRNRLEQPSLT